MRSELFGVRLNTRTALAFGGACAARALAFPYVRPLVEGGGRLNCGRSPSPGALVEGVAGARTAGRSAWGRRTAGVTNGRGAEVLEQGRCDAEQAAIKAVATASRLAQRGDCGLPQPTLPRVSADGGLTSPGSGAARSRGHPPCLIAQGRPSALRLRQGPQLARFSLADYAAISTKGERRAMRPVSRSNRAGLQLEWRQKEQTVRLYITPALA